MVTLVAALGCTQPSTPLPEETSLIKNDLTIPRELGPFGFDGRDTDPRWYEQDLERARFEMEFRCKEWSYKGVVHFGRVSGVLSELARTRFDLLDKVAFVRFCIPAHKMGGEFEGGTAELLIAIFRSGQHESVRLAALAALRGRHLEAGRQAGDQLVRLSEKCTPTDPCPEAVLPADSPPFTKLLSELLTAPVSPRAEQDLLDVVRNLTLDAEDLAACDDSLTEKFAAYLSAEHPTGRRGASVAISLAMSLGKRSTQIFVAALPLSRHRSRGTLRSLLSALEFHRGTRSQVSPELRSALEMLATDLDSLEDEPDSVSAIESIRTILRRSDADR